MKFLGYIFSIGGEIIRFEVKSTNSKLNHQIDVINVSQMKICEKVMQNKNKFNVT